LERISRLASRVSAQLWNTARSADRGCRALYFLCASI
jgi:hypothetical protein